MSRNNSSYNTSRHRGSYNSDMLAMSRKGFRGERRGSYRPSPDDLLYCLDDGLDEVDEIEVCEFDA